MTLQALLDRLGPEVEDPEEETFLLFAQDIPSQNLGFVDSRATTVHLTIAGKDYAISQSPSVLTSNREGGTTGAVVWKITPLVAEFLASPSNLLRQTGFLSPSSVVLELGCGVSGLLGLVVAPSIHRYVLTDQSYVARFVEKNLSDNDFAANNGKGSRSTAGKKRAKSSTTSSTTLPGKNVVFESFDWELDQATPALTGLEDVGSFDVVIACDCIYNEALIQPLVQSCVDVCRLRLDGSGDSREPALCVVGQQLRDPEIFESWIKEFHKYFRTWRIPEIDLSEALRANPGFVLHCGILR